ncbi:calcium/sodium antiporter [Maribellus sediminis]|uniref:calcium/sodium antiporter n=1 Tax=Maribellus sediminis TaxID=2696285 RepID=UPI0014300C13|nr:calcium/sodium antiporter [Maribellus sediminis]
MIIVYILVLLACFVVLARIVDLFFIASLDRISKDLRLSSDAAGATLMAVGSSAPELFVALFAVLKPGEHQAIGIGSIVGSAIFNLLVIVGAAAVVRKSKLNWRPLVRDLFFYTLAVTLLVVFIWDGKFTFTEAAIFMAVYALYVIAVVYWRRILPYEDMGEDVEDAHAEENRYTKPLDSLLKFFFPTKEKYYMVFFVSIVLIAVLSYVLVEVAVASAHILNIPEAIIALTVLAVGTSIPDLFSSIIVAKQGRGDMAVSNAIGSNIFDILVGLGLPFIIVMLASGGTIEAGGNLIHSVIILFGSVFLLVILLVFRRWNVGKPTGIILILVYLGYLVYEILNM